MRSYPHKGDYFMSEFEQVLEENENLLTKKRPITEMLETTGTRRQKQATATRNEHNSEVRELIQNVKQQREIREQMNEVVRDMKRARADAITKLRKQRQT